MGTVWWGQLGGVQGVWGGCKGAVCVLGVQDSAHGPDLLWGPRGGGTKWGFLLRPELGVGLGH